MGFDVGSVYGDVKLETSGFKKSVTAINQGQTDMSKKAAGAGSSFAGMWKQIAGGVGVTTLISKAFREISQQIKDTISKGLEFGKEWANVTTMLSVSEEETERLRKGLLNISPTLGDVTDLAKGMYQVLSASIEPAKAIEFLSTAAKAAKAGITDTTTAVDALSTVINAYGMDASKATDISDIMFQTVKRGKLTFGELAASLGTVAPVAGTIGIKFEEVAAAIASLTRVGIPAQTATMQLRQVMMAIIKPSEDAKEKAEELGLEWTAAGVRAKGLGGFLLDVKEKTKGNEAAMATLVPNVRALTGVMALAGRASEGFTEDLGLMKNASGKTEEAFQKQMESANFWVDTFKNQIKKMKVVFFESFVDGFKLAVENSKELDHQLKVMTKESELTGKASGQVAKGIWDVVKSITGFLSGGANYNKMIHNMAEEAVNIEERQEAVNKVIEKAKDVFKDTKESIISFIDQYTNYSEAAENAGGITLETLEIFEELGIKTKSQVQAEMKTLEDRLWKVVGSSAATKSGISELAEKLIEMKEELGQRISPQLKIFAGDLSDVNEEAIALGMEGLNPMNMGIELLGDSVQKGFVPSISKATTMIGPFSAGMIASLQIIKDNTDAADFFGVTLKGKLSEGLKKATESYDILVNSGEFAKLNLEDQKTIVGKLIGFYKDLGLEAPEDLKKIQESSERTTKEIKADWATVTSQLASAFGILGDEIGGGFGDILKSSAVALDQVSTKISELGDEGKLTGEDILTAIGPQLAGQIGASLGGVISGAKKNFGALGSTIGGTMGSIFGPIGKVVGSAFGGLIGGLFKKGKTEAEKAAEAAEQLAKQLEAQTKEAMAAMMKYGEISEATAKKIAELRKTHEGYVAESLAFADVIRDVGVNQENLNQLWAGASTVIDLMNNGMIKGTEGSKVLDEAFTQLAEGAKKFGKEGSAGMVSFILKTREAGIEVESVTEYVTEQLGRIPTALNVLIEKTGDYQGSAKKLGETVVTSFNAMLGSGMTWQEAMTAMSEPIAALREKYKNLGIEATGALADLFKITEVTEANKGFFDTLQANLEIMEALGNTGWLTAETFKDFASQAYNDFQDLKRMFGDDDLALRAMGPTLQTLADNASTYGYALDDNTQRLVDQAKEMGIVTEVQESEQEQQERLFGDLADKMSKIMEKLADDIGGFFKTAFGDAFADVEDQAYYARRGIENQFEGLDFKIGYKYEAENSPPATGDSGGNGGRGFASGIAFIPSIPTPITVHPGELVDITPLSEFARTGHSRAGLEMSEGKTYGDINIPITNNWNISGQAAMSPTQLAEMFDRNVDEMAKKIKLTLDRF